MTRIRVNPAILNQSAGGVSTTANQIHNIGEDVWRSASCAPSYDGQFGPKLRSIGQSAMAQAQRHSSRMSGLSGSLSKRASAFQAADGTNVLSSNKFPLNPYGLDYHNLNYLTKYSQIPASDLERYLNLGAFTLGVGTVSPSYGYCYESNFLSPKLKLEIPVGNSIHIWQNKAGRPPKDRAELGLKIPVWQDRVWEDEIKGTTELGGFLPLGGKLDAEILKGEAGFGVGFREGKGAYAGLFAEGVLASAGASGVIGNKDFGLAGGLEANAGKVEAFAGYKDGNFGAKIGASIVEVEGTIGLNVAGANVGIVGGVGLKFELGITLGKNARVNLGIFTLGLNIGESLGA